MQQAVFGKLGGKWVIQIERYDLRLILEGMAGDVLTAVSNRPIAGRNVLKIAEYANFLFSAAKTVAQGDLDFWSTDFEDAKLIDEAIVAYGQLTGFDEPWERYRDQFLSKVLAKLEKEKV